MAFKSIDYNQGMIKKGDEHYLVSRWNVKISWEDGSVTWEPLDIIVKSDPVTCAIYGDENGLLNEFGWKRFAHLARRKKKLLCMVHQAKLQSFCCPLVYKFRVQVPRNHEQAMELDRINGNTFWKDAE